MFASWDVLVKVSQLGKFCLLGKLAFLFITNIRAFINYFLYFKPVYKWSYRIMGKMVESQTTRKHATL